MGIDLADLGNKLTYGRLALILNRLPITSAYAREVIGESASWSTTDYLLAHLIDYAAMGNWQRGGGKGRKPQPIARPGKNDSKTRIGSGSMSLAAMRKWRDKRRA